MKDHHLETRHLADSDLLRLIDVRATANDIVRLRSHLHRCSRCTARFTSLRERTSHLSALIAQIEVPDGFPYPSMPETAAADRENRDAGNGWILVTRWIRAAAVFVLLLAPLLIIQPLRATVASWIGVRWTELATIFESPPSRVTTPAESNDAGSTIWFTVGEELLVTIDSPQSNGGLLLQPVRGSAGSVSVLGGSGDEILHVTEFSLRIQNSRESVGTYEIGLPSSVSRLQLRVGRYAPIILSTPEWEEGYTMSLQTPVR
ncbi:hypothetical protein BH23GEM8_BH23GEM8_10130 [soil metagenome]